MVWARFGFAGLGDELPIDQWMDDRDDYMGQRKSFDAAGQDAWNASTRSGENLDAHRPSDVTALGAGSVDAYGVAEANAGGSPPGSDGADPSPAGTANVPKPGVAANDASWRH